MVEMPVVKMAMAMYVVFTQVASPYVAGVQGRYLQLPYFAALMLVVMWLRSSPRVHKVLERIGRVDLKLLPWVVMLLSCVGTRAAFQAVIHKYYSPT